MINSAGFGNERGAESFARKSQPCCHSCLSKTPRHDSLLHEYGERLRTEGPPPPVEARAAPRDGWQGAE